MNEWFDVEKIDKNTFAISEYGHWEETHVYLFIGNKRAILIDSGLGIGNIKEVIQELTALPISVVITHAHWDHIGGCKWFSDIAVHKKDKDWVEKGLPVPLKVIRSNFSKYPLTKDPPVGFHPKTYVPFKGKVNHILYGNEVLDLGSRRLEIIHTPGHSPGHICIYEKETGLLATGDILYEGTLDAFYESTDPIQFAGSINKLVTLPNVTKLLPGHFRLDIPVSYLQESKKAFDEIKNRGLLKQGTGIYQFEHISIHL